MLTTILSTFLATIIATLVIVLSFILSSRSFNDRENSTPFECGFDPNDKARLPFSTRFFLLAVIFLVFDIEIVLLIPAPLIITISPSPYLIVTIFIFLLILLLGTAHEWREGSLSWSP